MKYLLRSEELLQCVACVAVLADFGAPWWWYLVLFIGPDIGMLGYLIGPRTGAFTYNALHHKGGALVVAAVGVLVASNALLFAGLCLFGHASLDRTFGYGLKLPDGFKLTHLGLIGGGA